MASRAMEVAMGVPALAPERSVTWPKRTRARFSNGLEVILAEAHSIPKFHGELFFRSGNAAAAHRRRPFLRCWRGYECDFLFRFVRICRDAARIGE